MIVPWLFRTFPGPAWLRVVLLLALAALLAWLLWEWCFPWLVRSFGSVLEDDPSISRHP